MPSLRPGGDTAAPAEEPIKIEKVDLTGDDDDGTLDSTLGYAAEYEGGYGEGQDFSGAALMDASAGVGGGVAGSSQRAADDGSQSGGFTCCICGRAYSQWLSLHLHMQVHEGLTKCPLCGKIASRISHLRRHIQRVHRLTSDEAWSLVPSRFHRTP